MATATLRPNETTQVSAYTLTGGASAHAILSDNSDASYLDTTVSGISTVQVGFGTVSIPANAQIRSVTARMRAKGTGTTAGVYSSLTVPNVGTALPWSPYLSVTSGSITTYTGTARSTITLNGGSTRGWQQSDLDNIRMSAGWYGGETADDFELYEFYIDVSYNEAPVVTVTAPAEGGTITNNSQPTVTWTYADPENDTLERFRVRIFTAAQYGAAGFDPSTSAAFWESGEQFQNALLMASGVPLPNGTYRAYVQAADSGSSGRYSAWDFNQFTIQIDPPAIPSIIATEETPGHRVELELQGRVNELSTNQGSAETDTTGFTSRSNATIAQSTAQALNGAASIAGTATAAGDVQFGTTGGTNSVPVRVGDTYTALVSVRAATTGRTVGVSLRFLDNTGTFLTEDFGADVVDTNTGWVQAVSTGVAPAGAVFVAVNIYISNCAAGETHYADQFSIAPGSSTAWTRGGLADTALFEVERSRDGGTTWEEVRDVQAQNPTNLLTDNQNSIETDTSGYSTTVNATISQSAEQALIGSYSLKMVSIAAGDMEAKTPSGTSGVPVTAGEVYVASAFFRAASTARECDLGFDWYNAAGTYLSTSEADDKINTTTGWTKLSRYAVAPAGAAFARIWLQVEATGGAGEIHYVDDVRIYAPFPSQLLTVYDYEVPSGQTAQYRSRSMANDTGFVLISAWSGTDSATPIFDSWLLKDPTDPALNQIVRPETFEYETPEPQGVYRPIGRMTAVVTSDGIKSISGRIGFLAKSKAEYDALAALLMSGRTLLLQDPFGNQWYVRIGAERKTQLIRAMDPSGTYPIRHLHRLTMDFTEVGIP